MNLGNASTSARVSEWDWNRRHELSLATLEVRADLIREGEEALVVMAGHDVEDTLQRHGRIENVYDSCQLSAVFASLLVRRPRSLGSMATARSASPIAAIACWTTAWSRLRGLRCRSLFNEWTTHRNRWDCR